MGKPKKSGKENEESGKSKKGSIKGDDAQDVVLKYLRKTNRPYSAVDVFNNLKGEIGKTQVVKILQQLQEQEMIHGKQYGKQWVYCQKQDDLPAPSPDELDEIDRRITLLKEEVTSLKEQVKQDQSVLNNLTSSLTNEQIKARLEQLQNE
ncbi:hypothetical protein HK102_004147, partial [Quaeritorhiza haematococci]